MPRWLVWTRAIYCTTSHPIYYITWLFIVLFLVKSKFNMSATSILDNMGDEKLESLALKTLLCAREEASSEKYNEIDAGIKDKDGTTTLQSLVDFIAVDKYMFERFTWFLDHQN